MDTQEKQKYIIQKYNELSTITKELFEKLKSLHTEEEISYTFKLIKIVEDDFVRLLYI